MSQRKPPDPNWVPSEDFLWFWNRELVRLDSPIAHERDAAICELLRQRRHDAEPRFRALLQDDAPVLFDRGTHITEIRMGALAALQSLHYGARSPLELGPVAVMRAWRVTDVRAKFEAAFAGLSEAQRQAVLHRVNEVMEQRVQPSPDEADDLRAYCVLQTLGLVTYHWQTPDPHTTLTPLQEEIFAEQVATRPPLPCLRMALLESPDKTIGWIYRNPTNRFWAAEVSEHPAADEVREALDRTKTLGSKGFPNVVHDASGQPVRGAEGKFVIDGDLDPDTADVIACLRSIAAISRRLFTIELHIPPEYAP